MADIFFGGGLNERDELNINPEECIEGENFLLDAQARTFRPRPPFDLKGTAPNGQPISGIMQLIKSDDTDSLLVTAGSKVYAVDDSFTFTEVGDITTSTGMRAAQWSLDDNLIIVDKSLNNVIRSWDGATFQKHKHGVGTGTTKTVASLTRSGSTATATVTSHGYSNGDLVTISGANETEYNGEFLITNVTTNTFDYTVSGTPSTPATGTISAEKSVDLYAKYAIVWNNRIWLFNIKEVNGATTSTNPHMILASKFDDGDTFDTSTRAEVHTSSGLTGDEAFFLLTPDLKPINGVAVFFETLIVSTVGGALYRLTGADASDYRIVPYYLGSAAVGSESIVNTGNDVMWMARGGEINSLSTVEAAGDVKADDISRWIPKQINGLSDSIAVYDQQRQRVHWFVTNKVLTLDKNFLFEKPGLSPWTVYTTQHDSGFNTNAVAYIRDPGTTTYDVYWGDSSGRLMKLNGTGSGDGGINNILTRRKSKQFLADYEFQDIVGRVEYRRKAAVQLILNFDWAVHNYIERATVNLLGPLVSNDAIFWGQSGIYFGENIYFGQGSVSSDILSNRGFSPAGKGDTFFLEVSVDTTSDFLINRIIL